MPRARGLRTTAEQAGIEEQRQLREEKEALWDSLLPRAVKRVLEDEVPLAKVARSAGIPEHRLRQAVWAAQGKPAVPKSHKRKRS